MNEMQRKKISQEELEKEGWEYVGMIFGYTHKIFKKEKKRILWHSQTQIVSSEWLEEEK